jgi:lysyl-tRNA synthetase class 2
MINLTPPWKRITMHEIVHKECGIDFSIFGTGTIDQGGDVEGAKSAAISVGISLKLLNNKKSVGEILNIVFEEICESKLIQPTFVCDHPIEISPLAKPHRYKEGLTERFEMFMVGREHANAFSELTDPIDQRERLIVQSKKKANGDDEACGVDEEFLSALEIGMPPTAGLGIGIDRIVMVLTNSSAIRDVIAFPLLRNEN